MFPFIYLTVGQMQDLGSSIVEILALLYTLRNEGC